MDAQVKYYLETKDGKWLGKFDHGEPLTRNPDKAWTFDIDELSLYRSIEAKLLFGGTTTYTVPPHSMTPIIKLLSEESEIEYKIIKHKFVLMTNDPTMQNKPWRHGDMILDQQDNTMYVYLSGELNSIYSATPLIQP